MSGCIHRMNGLGHCERCGARPRDNGIPAASAGQREAGEQWRLALEWALGLEPDPDNHTPEWAAELVRELREIGNEERPLPPSDEFTPSGCAGPVAPPSAFGGPREPCVRRAAETSGVSPRSTEAQRGQRWLK